MKKLIFRCLYYLQVHRLMRCLFRKKVVILMYHGFTNKKTYEGIENHDDKHLHDRAFKMQMEYLSKHYNVISLDRLVDYYHDGKELPDNSVVITIDDGYLSNYSIAYPILKQYNIPATVFLTGSFVEKREFLRMDRIEYAINETKVSELKVRIGGDQLSFDLSNTKLKILCEQEIKARLKALEPQDLVEGIVRDLENRLGQKLTTDSETHPNLLPVDLGRSHGNG